MEDLRVDLSMLISYLCVHLYITKIHTEERSRILYEYKSRTAR
jgi:hypothetical protein